MTPFPDMFSDDEETDEDDYIFERSFPPVWWEGNSEFPVQEFLTRWMK